MRRIGVAVCAACVLVAACGGSHDDAVPPRIVPAPLNDRELTWVRAYSSWAATFWDDGFDARDARIAGVCLEPLDEAGAAPTARLRAAEREARRVCRHLGGGSREDAEAAADAADDVLYPLLLANQALRVRSGVATSDSRVDLDLGLVAAAVSRENVEVRCWDAADWERFIGERNVWFGNEDDHFEVTGSADLDMGRIHLRLEDCNLLVSIRRENVESRSRDGLIAAGSALLTFAHEIGHFAAPDDDEAAVECAAYAFARRVAPELELTPPELDLLVAAYADEIAPTLPNSYRDPDCARG